MIAPNGNMWVGTGHNAVVTDLAGRDWFVYLAINRNDPYLDGTSLINERPMLIDRLDWVDGWPTVRGGHWASAGRRRAPVTRWDVGSEFNREGSISGWHRTDDTWNHKGRLGNARRHD